MQRSQTVTIHGAVTGPAVGILVPDLGPTPRDLHEELTALWRADPARLDLRAQSVPVSECRDPADPARLLAFDVARTPLCSHPLGAWQC